MSILPMITQDTYWTGASDRRTAAFENLFPIPRGVSYNSYVILDEKTVLMDTVDKAAAPEFLDQVEQVLDGRALDYVIIHHMEPDHCAALYEIVLRWPQVTLVCTAKAQQMIGQFFHFPLEGRVQLATEGGTLCTGKHTLQFFTAPMVHWPEVMITYDQLTKAIYTADAFGTFGAIGGSIYADEVRFESEWLDDARRYYGNIVGKYGAQVQALLKKIAKLDVAMICPLHGPIWRSNTEWFLNKYDLWSRWEPEEKAAVVIYGSMYGNTASAAHLIARQISADLGAEVKVYDLSNTDVSYLVSEVFRCSHIVLACPTYNGGLYPKMHNFLSDLQALGAHDRTFALAENGTWAPVAAKQMRTELEVMKNMKVLDTTLTIKSSLQDAAPALALADAVAADMKA